MVRKLVLTFIAVIGVFAMSEAQTRRVSGTVYAPDGAPAVGVSVLVEGTTQGTTTDVTGGYALTNVPADANLQFIFVGMETQTVPVAGKTTIDVYMKDDTTSIDDVIVVAFGTAKKEAFTGSVSVVGAEDINKMQTTNAVNALQGKAAGVQLNNVSGQPGVYSPEILIRGVSSIFAGTSPLIIVDGAPFDGDLNSISAQDVESMSVLKDAASSALYGARGANGVIIITTKRGKTGSARVTVDAKWGVNSRATQDYNFIKDPAQYYELWYGALHNYAVNAQGMSEQAAYQYANANLTSTGSAGLGVNVYTVPEGQTLIGQNGKLNPNATLGRMVSYRGEDYWLYPDDWSDEIYKSSFRQEYTVTADASNERSSFYASVNYLDTEGISAKSDYTRLSGRLRADYQLKKWLKIGGNMSYSHYNSNYLDTSVDGSTGSSGNIFAFSKVGAIYPLYMRGADKQKIYDSNGVLRYDYGDGANGGSTRPFLGNSNGVSDAMLNVMNFEGNTLNATGFFEVKFLKDFTFTSSNTVMNNEERDTDTTNPYYGSYASSNGIVSKAHTRRLTYNFQQLLNYNKQVGEHTINAMIGHEYYRNRYYYLYAHKTNQFDPSNTELAGAILEGSSNSYTTEYNTEGYFGRAEYNYGGRYNVSASYRRDASSRFHPDHRWGNFWSAGAAWLISNESWFNADWVDMLKIKASYGQQGNDNIGNYRYTNIYDIVNSNGSPAAVPSTMGNPNITWETNANFNAGVDFSFWGSRLTGTVEFFNRKTTDMLFSFPLPPSMGYTSYYANVGDMRNLGVEIELEGTLVRTKDINWSVSFNLTHYKNKITYLPEERRTMDTDGVSGFSSGSMFYGQGLPIFTYRTVSYAGVSETGEALYWADVTDDDGNVIGQKTVTNPSNATYHLHGTTLPDVYGGFGTNFSWKGLDFSIDFMYQIGGKVYDTDYAQSMAVSAGRAFHADLLKSWTPENASSNIPRFQYNDQYTASTSDRFLTDASYLSLQNISLGYTLPHKWTSRISIDKVRFYVAADNVWVWSKRQGLDPRQSISGGVTSAYYAPIRTISGGVTFTF